MNNEYMSSYRLRSNTNYEHIKRDHSKLNIDMDNIRKSNFTSNDSYIYNPNKQIFHTSYKDNSQMNTSESHSMLNPFSKLASSNCGKTSNEFTPRIKSKRMEDTTPFTDSRLIRHANDHMDDSLQMMNFKINFDILKNKIARLNSLVPSMNNSNDYSHITQSADQHNQNYDRHFEEAQKRKSILNKMKMYNDYEHVSNNINITDYHTLIYNNNAIMLESKKSSIKGSRKRKEKDNNQYTEYSNNYDNRHTINFGLSGAKTYSNLNRQSNNINNPNRNHVHHFSNKTNPNANNLYLNTSISCCDLLTESVTQFSITPSNRTAQAVRHERDDISNTHKSKSCSFNLSDIADDIINIKNTPTKDEIEKVGNMLYTCACDPNKELCNADTTKGNNLYRDLHTRQFRTIYDRSREEEFFLRINLQDCKIEQSDHEDSLLKKEEVMTYPVRCEITPFKELLNNEEKKELITSVDDVLCNNKLDENTEFNNIQTISSENGLEIKNKIKYNESDESYISLSIKQTAEEYMLKKEESHLSGRYKPNDLTEKTAIDLSTINKIEEDDKSPICNNPNYEIEKIAINDCKKESFDNIVQQEVINKIQTKFPIESTVNNEEINPNQNDEDEDDYEADLIINEIIKNSKLKHEQEMSQMQSSTPIKKEHNPIETNLDPKAIQEDYFKCNEEKIEIRESLRNCIDKSRDDSLIFAEADNDANMDFDIQDQLCSEQNSLMIIEDIIEKSLNELSYSMELSDNIEGVTENSNVIRTHRSENKSNSSIQIKINLTADNKIANCNKNFKIKKIPLKKNVAISSKVITVTYEQKSCVPNLFQRKSDGSLLKLKNRDIGEYLKKLYKNSKPKPILKKIIPKVDEKELALRRLTALITEFDDSKESEADTANFSKSVSMAEKKRIEHRNKKFIQQIESAHKTGKNFRNLNPKVLILKKKKDSENLCNKFKLNPNKFFSRPPCQNVLKSLNVKSLQDISPIYGSARTESLRDMHNGKLFYSEQNTPNKIKKRKILLDIINNIDLEENLKELDIDSKILTHQSFSNLSLISGVNSEDKEFLMKSPEQESHREKDDEEKSNEI